MKNKNHFPLKVLLYICLVGFLSCGKEDATSETDFTASPQLLKERRINNLLHSTFKYNNEGLIEELTTYQPTGGPLYVDTYIYDVDTTTRTRVNAETNVNIYTRKYYDVSEDQGRRDSYESGEYIGYRYYNFKEDASCGYHNILTYNTFGQLVGAVDYDFTDENCSYTASVSSSITTSYVESEFFRGEKYDAYNSIRIPFFRISKYNTTTSYINRNENGDLIEANSYSTDIEYNEMDHPVKETRNYRNGNVRVYTYEYY